MLCDARMVGWCTGDESGSRVLNQCWLPFSSPQEPNPWFTAVTNPSSQWVLVTMWECWLWKELVWSIHNGTQSQELEWSRGTLVYSLVRVKFLNEQFLTIYKTSDDWIRTPITPHKFSCFCCGALCFSCGALCKVLEVPQAINYFSQACAQSSHFFGLPVSECFPTRD